MAQPLASGLKAIQSSFVLALRSALVAVFWRHEFFIRAVNLLPVYDPDDRDRVVPLDDVPQCDIGAPMPALAAAEHSLRVAYITDEPEAKEPVAVVTFHRPYAHYFGPPNDEAFSGHSLAGRGLTPYGAFRIVDSSWVRRLEHMNRVHEYHDPKVFAAHTHYVLSFHDSTFECVAMGYEIERHTADRPLTLAVEVNPQGVLWVNPLLSDN